MCMVGGVYRLTERRKNSMPDRGDRERDPAGDRAHAAPCWHHLFAERLSGRGQSDGRDAPQGFALQSELAVAQVQLLRPTVQIQPDRSMVQIAQSNVVVLPDTRSESSMPRPRQGLLRAGPVPALPEPDDSAPPWAGLAAASGRALSSPGEQPAAPDERASPADDGAPPWAGLAAASGRALSSPGEQPAPDERASLANDSTPPWARLAAASGRVSPR